jgi:hypothetical protein
MLAQVPVLAALNAAGSGARETSLEALTGARALGELGAARPSPSSTGS